jgi:hypothetical protein
MKKLLLAVFVAGALSLTGCGGGQKNMSMSTSVPTTVLNQFEDMYPSASNVKWKEKNGLYESSFKAGDKKMKAEFTPDGSLVRTSM